MFYLAHIKWPICFAGLCIPNNNTIFIKTISEKLAANEPHLTLEFLEECIQGFRNSHIELKHLCLEYMTPWLPNLTRYTFVLSPYFKFLKFNLNFMKIVNVFWKCCFSDFKQMWDWILNKTELKHLGKRSQWSTKLESYDGWIVHTRSRVNVINTLKKYKRNTC